MTAPDDWMGTHGWRVLVQPNGRLAIFSMATDEMVAVNMTDDEIAVMVLHQEREAVIRRAACLAQRMVTEAREDSRERCTRWDRTLAMLGEMRGEAYVEQLTKRCA